MFKRVDIFLRLGILIVLLLGVALAQPFQWPEAYAASISAGDMIRETTFGDITTLNPYLASGATEAAVLGMFAGPNLVYRDWLGTRSFRDAEGNFNTYWAKSIEEVVQEQEFIIELRQGWFWSDGVEMTADDLVAGRLIIGDAELESNSFSCSVVDSDPVLVEKLDSYRVHVRLPTPQVNAIANNVCPAMPAHIFMPVYESQGAAGVKAMWGVNEDISTIVSGGPYILSEFRPGERLVLERNPSYGNFVQAADGSPVAGAERWVVTIYEDQNAVLAAVVTGQADFYWPRNLDQVRAVKEATDRNVIGGTLYANISPSTSTDFITYNFNSTDSCKAEMFRNQLFRQAISIMIDRDALVQAALGGLGFPAIAQTTEAIAPFVTDLPPFEFNPDEGVALLEAAGYTASDSDGVLMNPDTGCRVAFELQFNSGNDRRAQQALVVAQTVAPYGVAITPREVSTDIWQQAILGTSMPRQADYDAQVWGLTGGDIDNPSSNNVLRIAANLNAWNKDKDDVEAWELLMDRLTVEMDSALDLDTRVALFKQRAAIMRDYLPLTPLIAQSFHYYDNLGNTWSADALDAVSIQEPYRPANYRENLVAP